MSDWQIWFMKPDWLARGRFYDERPDPRYLARTHVHVGSCPAGVREMHVLRDYKEFVFNTYAPRHPKPGPGERRQMAQGDVMVSPKGDVWLVEFWGFEFLGPDKVPRQPSPMYTVEDIRRAQRPDGPGLPVIRLHHRADVGARPLPS